MYLSNADSKSRANFNPYLNQRNREAFIGNIAKIFVFPMEYPEALNPKTSQLQNLINFNQNLEKFVDSGKFVNVVFMRIGQITAQGSFYENGSYLPGSQPFLVPPNIRVNFNLAMNFYCNSQQSIKVWGFVWGKIWNITHKRKFQKNKNKK